MLVDESQWDNSKKNCFYINIETCWVETLYLPCILQDHFHLLTISQNSTS